MYFTPLSATQTPSRAGSAAAPSPAFPVAALTFATSAGDDDAALNGGGAEELGTPVLFRNRASNSPIPPSRAATPHTASPQPLPLAANRQQVTWQSGGGSTAGPGFKAAMDRVWARVSAMETALQTLTTRPAAA